jgi:shikimate dehydrogenase
VTRTGTGQAITAATTVLGVIGDPVAHSLSPVIHNAAYEALGLDAIYVGLPVQAALGRAAVSACRTLGLRGLSVTMPHKEAVAETADEVSDDVALLGAANTLINNNGTIRAEITDGDGCVDSVRAAGFDPAGQRCMVVGAGGSGRSVSLALSRAGAEVVVVNRSVERATHVVAMIGAGARVGSLDDVSSMALIVNATPQGMGSEGMGTDGSVPVDPARLGSYQLVVDLVYHPLTTPLLQAATDAGATPIDGLWVLIHQAVRQIELWTGEQAPVAVMRVAAEAELARRLALAGSAK